MYIDINFWTIVFFWFVLYIYQAMFSFISKLRANYCWMKNKTKKKFLEKHRSKIDLFYPQYLNREYCLPFNIISVRFGLKTLKPTLHQSCIIIKRSNHALPFDVSRFSKRMSCKESAIFLVNLVYTPIRVPTGLGRVPKSDKTPITWQRGATATATFYFCNIQVRPWSCPSYPLWRQRPKRYFSSGKKLC